MFFYKRHLTISIVQRKFRCVSPQKTKIQAIVFKQLK